jgi:hypothetical protein
VNNSGKSRKIGDHIPQYEMSRGLQSSVNVCVFLRESKGRDGDGFMATVGYVPRRHMTCNRLSMIPHGVAQSHRRSAQHSTDHFWGHPSVSQASWLDSHQPHHGFHGVRQPVVSDSLSLGGSYRPAPRTGQTSRIMWERVCEIKRII